MNEKVIETPERIFLNVGDLSDIDDPALFKNLEDVTWCGERIDEHDIEYVRADLAASASAEPVGEVGEPFGNQINWLGKVPKPGTKLYARPIEAPEHKK